MSSRNQLTDQRSNCYYFGHDQRSYFDSIGDCVYEIDRHRHFSPISGFEGAIVAKQQEDLWMEGLKEQVAGRTAEGWQCSCFVR